MNGEILIGGICFLSSVKPILHSVQLKEVKRILSIQHIIQNRTQFTSEYMRYANGTVPFLFLSTKQSRKRESGEKKRNLIKITSEVSHLKISTIHNNFVITFLRKSTFFVQLIESTF